MTGLNTHYVSPQRRVYNIASITDSLIDHNTKLTRQREHRDSIMEKIRALSREVIQIDRASARVREQAAMLEELARKPEPVPAQTEETPGFESVGGRPIKGVLSTQKWYELMTGDSEAIKMVAHYYGRPDAGMARLRIRALNGELPESKVQHEMLRMLQDGEDPVLVAETVVKPVNWVRNYNNLLTAYNRMYNEGKNVPINIVNIIQGR